MSANLVNLDAVIPREDWEAMPDDPNLQVYDTGSIIQIKAIELEETGLAFNLLKKPEFQRETPSWEPEKVVDLVKSFLNADLIPSIMLWRNETSGNLFVIDGAHRVGALIAWVHDDYGDGIISNRFFKKIIPPEQAAAAKKTRDLMHLEVGKYTTIKTSGNLPITVKEGKFARTLLQRSLFAQQISGSSAKAEASFFKINQKAAPISTTELQLIGARNKSHGIATRALVRSGVGHKFWKKFPENVQADIERTAHEIYSYLFKPPLTNPISIGLDLPIAGRGYSSETISLLLAFVNLTIEAPSKKSKGQRRDKLAEPPDDLDGTGTKRILQDVQNITTRMAGKMPRSLGLHSAVYFYSATGRFQPSSFLATASLMLELDTKPDDRFDWFTLHRSKFEFFLLRHRYLVNQMVIKHGSMEKSHGPLLDLYRTILELAANTVKEPEIMGELIGRFSYLKEQVSSDFDAGDSDFSPQMKSAALRRAGIEKLHICDLCNAPIHPNAIQLGHITDIKHGGAGNRENAGISHAYCNSAKDKLLPLFKSQNN